jgi:hypothetical protein
VRRTDARIHHLEHARADRHRDGRDEVAPRIQAIDAVDAQRHQHHLAGGVEACPEEQADVEFAAHAPQAQFGDGPPLD